MSGLTRGPVLPNGQIYREGCPNCGGPTEREEDYCLACRDASIIIQRLKAAWVPCVPDPHNTGVTIARDWSLLQLAIKVIDLPVADWRAATPEALNGHTGPIGLFVCEGGLGIDA